MDKDTYPEKMVYELGYKLGMRRSLPWIYIAHPIQNTQGGFENMRNLGKITAAVLAIALVLTSMAAVFADDATTANQNAVANADKAATLKDLGLYAGQDANDPEIGLEDALTTQDSLIFLAKLFGYYETANKLTADQVSKALAKFDDAASISDYAKNVVAYSAADGILRGSTQDGKFFVGAKDTVTAARFATFILRQMGYTVADYKQSVAKLAETKGSKVDAAITGDLTRDVAVGIMYGVLTAEKASQKTVIADIVGDNTDLKAKAVKAGLIVAAPIGGGSVPTGGGDPTVNKLIVQSVTALNTKQVEIKFNADMDKESAEDEANYEINSNGSDSTTGSAIGVALTTGSAILVDSKTVVITVPGKLDDNTEYEVVVKKAIKDAAGTKMENDYVTTFTTGDYTPPEIYEDDCCVVKADGKIYLKFSEQMNESQMLDKSNYIVQPKDSAAWRELDDDEEISKISEKVVLIDLNEEVDLPDVKIAPIMDLAGNTFVDSKTLMNIDVELKPEVVINRAELTTINKIKIAFDTELDTFDYSDVELCGTSLTTYSAIGISSVESQTVNDDGNTEIVLVLDQDVNSDATFTYYVEMIGYYGRPYDKPFTEPIYINTKATTSSKSVFGTELKPSQKNIKVADKAAPEIAKYKFKGDDDKTPEVVIYGYKDKDGEDGIAIDPENNYNKLNEGNIALVSITFTDAIDFTSLSIDTFKVDGYTVKEVQFYDANNNGRQEYTESYEVILRIEAKSDNTPSRTTVTQALNISDMLGNVLVAPGSTWTIRDLADWVK